MKAIFEPVAGAATLARRMDTIVPLGAQALGALNDSGQVAFTEHMLWRPAARPIDLGLNRGDSQILLINGQHPGAERQSRFGPAGAIPPLAWCADIIRMAGRVIAPG